jgi:hypothetical protein
VVGACQLTRQYADEIMEALYTVGRQWLLRKGQLGINHRRRSAGCSHPRGLLQTDRLLKAQRGKSSPGAQSQ